MNTWRFGTRTWDLILKVILNLRLNIWSMMVWWPCFSVGGLEIKRKIVAVNYPLFRKSKYSGCVALGGMIIPALIYTIFNNGNKYSSDGNSNGYWYSFCYWCSFIAWKQGTWLIESFNTAPAVVDDLGLWSLSHCFILPVFHWCIFSISAGIFFFCWFWINTKWSHCMLIYLWNFVVVLHVLLWCPFNNCRGFAGNDYSIWFKNETSSLLYLEHRLHTPR